MKRRNCALFYVWIFPRHICRLMTLKGLKHEETVSLSLCSCSLCIIFKCGYTHFVHYLSLEKVKTTLKLVIFGIFFLKLFAFMYYLSSVCYNDLENTKVKNKVSKLWGTVEGDKMKWELVQDWLHLNKCTKT